MSRKSGGFRQLLRYMHGRAVKEKGSVTHNLFSSGGDVRAIEREFLDNSRYLKPRKNGVVLYHEILAFSPKDRERLSLPAMHDFARRYLSLRAPESLGYAVVHDDTPSPHIHLMISGNVLYSGKKLRQSKAEFAKIKLELEAYQKAAYPELAHSIAQKNAAPKIKKTRGEQERERRERDRPSPPPSGKEAIAQAVRSCLKARTAADFQASLEAAGMGFYVRGGNAGVIAQETGRRYRLSTLGLADEFAQALDRWQAIRERQEAAAGLGAAKRRKEWRDAGFREQLAETLQLSEQPPTRRRQRHSGRGK